MPQHLRDGNHHNNALAFWLLANRSHRCKARHIVRDNFGKLSLCELELIEPELWFRNNPSAADELAKACLEVLS